MNSGETAAISAIMLGVFVTVLGMLVILLFNRRAQRSEGSVDDDPSALGSALSQREGEEPGNPAFARRSGAVPPRANRRLTRRPTPPSEAPEVKRRLTGRWWMYHASTVVAVASLALLFGSALGMLVRWLIGK